MRAAGCYGVNSVFYTGRRYDLAKPFYTDTQRAFEKLPLIGVEDLQAVKHYYSVPYSLVKQELDVRFTMNTVECFYRNQRVASHVRSDRIGHHTTRREHMPESHRQYGDWSPERLVRWARQYGSSTTEVVTRILQARHHPEQGYRSCLGILRLEKTYGQDRLEAACQRALLLGTLRYKSIESILKHGLDKQPSTPDVGLCLK